MDVNPDRWKVVGWNRACLHDEGRAEPGRQDRRALPRFLNEAPVAFARVDIRRMESRGCFPRFPRVMQI